MVNHPNRSKNLSVTQVLALARLEEAADNIEHWGDGWVTASHTGFDGKYSPGSRAQINTFQSLVRRGFADQRHTGTHPGRGALNGRIIRDAAKWRITEEGRIALALAWKRSRGEG